MKPGASISTAAKHREKVVAVADGLGCLQTTKVTASDKQQKQQIAGGQPNTARCKRSDRERPRASNEKRRRRRLLFLLGMDSRNQPAIKGPCASVSYFPGCHGDRSAPPFYFTHARAALLRTIFSFKFKFSRKKEGKKFK
jgi:hypothetical protein